MVSQHEPIHLIRLRQTWLAMMCRRSTAPKQGNKILKTLTHNAQYSMYTNGESIQTMTSRFFVFVSVRHWVECCWIWCVLNWLTEAPDFCLYSNSRYHHGRWQWHIETTNTTSYARKHARTHSFVMTVAFARPNMTANGWAAGHPSDSHRTHATNPLQTTTNQQQTAYRKLLCLAAAERSHSWQILCGNWLNLSFEDKVRWSDKFNIKILSAREHHRPAAAARVALDCVDVSTSFASRQDKCPSRNSCIWLIVDGVCIENAPYFPPHDPKCFENSHKMCIQFIKQKALKKCSWMRWYTLHSN